MIFRRLLVLLIPAVLGIGATPGRLLAQSPGDRDPSLPVYRQVIPNPTGKNGYEELVLAGELLQTSVLYTETDRKTPALSLKRRVLADRPVVRALALLHQGLAKSVISPRTVYSTTDPFPEFSLFRGLGRLLALQQYVLLADGRSTEALENTRLGLQLGRAVQTDTLVAGLVGTAIGSRAVSATAAHLDQLSARDCDLLLQICTESLSRPSPVEAVLEGERRFGRQALEETRQKGVGSLVLQRRVVLLRLLAPNNLNRCCGLRVITSCGASKRNSESRRCNTRE